MAESEPRHAVKAGTEGSRPVVDRGEDQRGRLTVHHAGNAHRSQCEMGVLSAMEDAVVAWPGSDPDLDFDGRFAAAFECTRAAAETHYIDHLRPATGREDAGDAKRPSVDARPRFRRLPVPYVVPWTGETGFEPLMVIGRDEAGVQRVRLKDETPDDRDEHGVLWCRTFPRTGDVPQMGDVHDRRQRVCMLTPRCQVCGRDLDPTAVPWLLSSTEMATMRAGGRRLTPTPPTCLDCVPPSRRLCPTLREAGSTLLTVHEVRPWGVSGIVHTTAADAAAMRMWVQMRRKRWVGFGDTERLALTIAQELVVYIGDYDVVDVCAAQPTSR